ncbi:MAG: TIGR02300 family protein [Pseudomonadota bacterium]|nr:TIGR02300 family protein [Pseudomonadota bacterium]
MTKPEWGLKRKCLKCGTFFYDMRKKSFSCPKCGEKYSLDTYEEAKTKQLLNLAKKAAPKLDDENLDENALLQMTEDVPLVDADIGADNLDMLEEEETNENSSPELTGFVEDYDSEDKNER